MTDLKILPQVCFGLSWCMGLGTVVVCAGGPPDNAPGRLASVVRADHRTGKLVRVVQTAQGQAQSPSALFSPTVERIAAEQALPPELIHSVIKAESNYNPFAVSAKGALGIMQLVPETARRFGVSNTFDAVENIQGGARYLKYLLDFYHGDYPLALAAYNAGEGAVARHGGVPPYPETRNYVDTVRKELQKAAVKPVEPKPREGSGGKIEAGTSGFNPIRQVMEPDGTVRYVSR
jgi:soluble lytic murein transglycosylase-like protein